MHVENRLKRDGLRWRDSIVVNESSHLTRLEMTTSDNVGAKIRRWPRIITIASVSVAVLIVGVVVAVVSSGGSTSGGTSGSLPSAPASTDPMSPIGTTAYPGTPPTPRPITTLAELPSGNVISMPWQLLAIRDGGRSLVVMYVGGNAGDIAPIGFAVAEEQDSVELTAVSVDNGNATSDLSIHNAVGIIRLADPLGSRVLLHAPTSPEWELPQVPGR